MVSLREFKLANCNSCFYNGWQGQRNVTTDKLFCAYRGKIDIDTEAGVCHTKTENGDPERLRG